MMDIRPGHPCDRSAYREISIALTIGAVLGIAVSFFLWLLVLTTIFVVK